MNSFKDLYAALNPQAGPPPSPPAVVALAASCLLTMIGFQPKNRGIQKDEEKNELTWTAVDAALVEAFGVRDPLTPFSCVLRFVREESVDEGARPTTITLSLTSVDQSIVIVQIVQTETEGPEAATGSNDQVADGAGSSPSPDQSKYLGSTAVTVSEYFPSDGPMKIQPLLKFLSKEMLPILKKNRIAEVSSEPSGSGGGSSFRAPGPPMARPMPPMGMHPPNHGGEFQGMLMGPSSSVFHPPPHVPPGAFFDPIGLDPGTPNDLTGTLPNHRRYHNRFNGGGSGGFGSGGFGGGFGFH